MDVNEISFNQPKQFLDVDSIPRQEKSNFEFSAEGV